MIVFRHLFLGRSCGRWRAHEHEWDTDSAHDIVPWGQLENSVEMTSSQPIFPWQYINATETPEWMSLSSPDFWGPLFSSCGNKMSQASTLQTGPFSALPHAFWGFPLVTSCSSFFSSFIILSSTFSVQDLAGFTTSNPRHSHTIQGYCG